MTPDEMRDALAAAFMHEGTFRDLQANDDWGYAAADLALTVVAGECTCPLAPVVYEGPQEDCGVHGERRSVLIGQRDEALRLRAAVERVRTLCDGREASTPPSTDFHGNPMPALLSVTEVRAALDGEPGDGE